MVHQAVSLTQAQREKTLAFLQMLRGGTTPPTSPAGIATEILAVFARSCVHLLAHDNQAAHSVVAEAESVYLPILEHPEPASLNLDPAIIAAHYALLTAAGLHAASMDKVVRLMAQALNDQPEASRQQARMRLTLATLRTAGIDVQMTPAPYSVTRLLRQPVELIALNSNEIQQLLDHVVADQISLDAEAAEILSLIALSELRNYRIDLGARILRLVFSQGFDNSYAEEALRFVALQRRRDGGYGFLDPFRENSDAQASPMLTFHLPITLNSVWLFSCYQQLSVRTAPAKLVM